MISNILAIQDYTKYLPHAILGVCGTVLLIALIVGFVKGARQVRWAGVAWLLAGITYFIVRKYLAGLVPLKKLLQGKMDDSILVFATSLALAIASVIVIGLLYGLFVLILRPRKEKRKKKEPRLRVDEIGLRYDDDYDYEGGFAYDNKHLRVKPKKKKVSLAGRAFGALLCVINTAMIVAVALTILLFVVEGTALKDGFFAPIYDYSITHTAVDYASTYGIDLAIIGILFAFLRKGTQIGFVDALRVLFIKFGGTVSVILGLYLPFSPFASSVPLVGGLTERCRGLFGTFGAGEKVAFYGGNILSGLLLVLVLVLAFWVINFLLKHLGNGLRKITPLKAADCALASLVYLVFSVVIMALVCLVLYVLAHYGIFGANGLLEKSELTGGMFDFFDVYVQKYLIMATDKIKEFVDKIYSFIA